MVAQCCPRWLNQCICTSVRVCFPPHLCTFPFNYISLHNNPLPPIYSSIHPSFTKPFIYSSIARNGVSSSRLVPECPKPNVALEPNVCVCVCVCVYLHTCECVRGHVCVCVCVHPYVRVHLCVSIMHAINIGHA